MARKGQILNPLAALGAAVTFRLRAFGDFWIFAAGIFSFIPVELALIRGWRRLLPQCYAIGTQSVPVVMLTGMFVGMVLVVQGWQQFDASGLADRLGAIVNISLAAELGPVLAGVVIAGRVGGALTAELGTMNVTEQLLAMRSMGADPIRFLATPRFVACTVLTPVLTCYADLTGAMGGWAVYSGVFGGESSAYWFYTRQTVQMWDLGTGLFKAVFFGAAIGAIGCYKGFHCKPGAEGVGQACTESFVASFILILVLDFFINFFLNALYTHLFGYRSLIG